MIKFKEFDVGDNNYEEQLEQFQTEHPTAEFVQITGGYTSYEKIWFKYEPSDISDSTDKLSVEKLQEHLLPYSQEMVQKIRDEKMQLVTADEFVKLHKESLTAIRENDKLQEQLNTAKYFFKNILDVNPNLKKGSYAHLSNCVNVMKNSAEKALAAIGGDDE